MLRKHTHFCSAQSPKKINRSVSKNAITRINTMQLHFAFILKKKVSLPWKVKGKVKSKKTIYLYAMFITASVPLCHGPEFNNPATLSTRLLIVHITQLTCCKILRKRLAWHHITPSLVRTNLLLFRPHGFLLVFELVN